MLKTRRKKQREKITQQNKQTTAKLAEIANVSKRTDALSSGKKATPPTPKPLAKKSNGVERAIAKMGEKSRPSHSENLAELKSRREERHDAFHAATNHRYDVAEKGISDEERAIRRQNIRTATLGEMMGGRDDEAADVMKAKMKYMPKATSFERGVANTSTAGLVNLGQKRLTRDGYKEAEEYYQQNKSKGAETLGSFLGGMALYGGTAGTFEGLGQQAVNRAAQTAVGKRLGAEALAKTMAGEGIKAGLARSLVGDAIQDSTIGAFDTTMDVLSRDDLETPSDYAKAFIGGQALNYGMGLAGNMAFNVAAPAVGKAVGNWWGDFADQSRRLYAVPEGVANAVPSGNKLYTVEVKGANGIRTVEVEAKNNREAMRLATNQEGDRTAMVVGERAIEPKVETPAEDALPVNEDGAPIIDAVVEEPKAEAEAKEPKKSKPKKESKDKANKSKKAEKKSSSKSKETKSEPKAETKEKKARSLKSLENGKKYHEDIIASLKKEQAEKVGTASDEEMTAIAKKIKSEQAYVKKLRDEIKAAKSKATITENARASAKNATEGKSAAKIQKSIDYTEGDIARIEGELEELVNSGADAKTISRTEKLLESRRSYLEGLREQHDIRVKEEAEVAEKALAKNGAEPPEAKQKKSSKKGKAEDAKKESKKTEAKAEVKEEKPKAKELTEAEKQELKSKRKDLKKLRGKKKYWDGEVERLEGEIKNSKNLSPREQDKLQNKYVRAAERRKKVSAELIAAEEDAKKVGINVRDKAKKETVKPLKEEIYGKDKDGWSWGRDKDGKLFYGNGEKRELFTDTPENRKFVENYWKHYDAEGNTKAKANPEAEKANKAKKKGGAEPPEAKAKKTQEPKAEAPKEDIPFTTDEGKAVTGEAKVDAEATEKPIKAEKAPSEKKVSKAAQERARKAEARERLDALKKDAEKQLKRYEKGDNQALKELVDTESEIKKAYREAGMSRSDEYRQSKEVFAKHEKEYKAYEKDRAARAEKSRQENVKFYKEKQKESLDAIKNEPESPKTDNFAFVDESPFDEASTRTTRTKPKYTSNENKAKAERAAKNKKSKATTDKVKKKQNTFRRNATPRGEGLHKNTYKNVTGKELDEAITPPSFEDTYKAMKTYAEGQASNAEEVTSRAYVGLTNATTDEVQRDFLKNGLADGQFKYLRKNNQVEYTKAVKRWVDNPKRVAEELIEFSDDISKLSVDRMVETHYQAWAVMKMLRKQLDNADLTDVERESVRQVYSAAADLSQKLSSYSGQTNQFQGVMVHCAPQKRVKNAVDNIVDILDSSGGHRRRTRIEEGGVSRRLSGDATKRRQEIRNLVLEDEEIKATLKKVFDSTTEEEYGTAMEELLLKAYKIKKASAFDYLQQWRYLAMLGNPRTHFRNIIGNITFGGVRQISNAVRSTIESSRLIENYAAKHGLELEKHGGLSPKAFAQSNFKKLAKDDASRAAWESFEKNSKEILGSQKYESPEMKEFLGGLAEWNANRLSGEDDFFRSRSYREQYIKSYNKWMKKLSKEGGEMTDDIAKRIHQEALRESQVATFNEANALAQMLNKSQRAMYDANASFGKKAIAFGSNAMLPFTKVPANILKQSINYSPAGILKGFAHIRDAAIKGDSALLNEAIDEMASGLTGTMVAALGYYFGKNTDFFTTNAGSEDKAATFKKRQGVQNYSVKVKGADGKEYSVTLDWMVPISSTFFTGVEIANQFKNGLQGINAGEAMSDIAQITSRVIDPVLETSMLSSIYNIVENTRKNNSYDDQQSFANIVLREIVQSYISSYVPTLQGQLARTFAYDSDKFVTGESDREYWLNSMKVKMGLADTDILTDALGADVNAYGEVKNKKTTASDYAKSFLKNAVIPANIQEINLTDIDKQKIKEYEDYVAGGGDPEDKAYLFPTKQYRKQFSYGKSDGNKVDIKLTNKQVSLYNQAKTTGGEEGMRTVLEGIMFNRYDKDSSGKRTVLKDGYTEEQKAQLIAKFKGKSLREVEEWLYKQPQFKTATEEEKRKVLNALWSYSTQGKAQGAKRVGEQAVVKDQGKSISEYNFKNELSKKKQEALQPYIDSGLLTYDDCVNFARDAGKTYYYESDEGGSANTYYNKKQMLEYLQNKGYSYEQAEALYNAFKSSNAKAYNGSASSSGSGGRYRGRRSRGRRGSSKKATVPTPKKISASAFKAGEALVSKSSKSKSRSQVPTLKRVEAKIDLPTPKTKKR